MDLPKRIKNYLVLQCVFAVLTMLLLMWGHAGLFIIGMCIVGESIFIVFVMWNIIKPLRELDETLDACIRENGSDERLARASAELPYIRKIELLMNKHAEERTRKNSAEFFDKEAELTALQSQINPHFLYNTLESVRGQALIDGNVEIAKMMEALSAFFRYSISRKGSLVTLRDELSNIENYMMIQRYRFNNRFSMEIFVDEEDEGAYEFRIPKLIIQPVVENAIFHGLEERLEGGKVTIEIIVTEKNLIITVSDNGKGMDGRTLAELNARIHSGTVVSAKDGKSQTNTGIGLPNIHKRIQLLFGEEYGLSVYSTLNQGTDVEITVPASSERKVE